MIARNPFIPTGSYLAQTISMTITLEAKGPSSGEDKQYTITYSDQDAASLSDITVNDTGLELVKGTIGPFSTLTNLWGDFIPAGSYQLDADNDIQVTITTKVKASDPDDDDSTWFVQYSASKVQFIEDIAYTDDGLSLVMLPAPAFIPPGTFSDSSNGITVTIDADCAEQSLSITPEQVTLPINAPNAPFAYDIGVADGKLELSTSTNFPSNLFGRWVPNGTYQMNSKKITIKVSANCKEDDSNDYNSTTSQTYDAEKAPLLRDIWNSGGKLTLAWNDYPNCESLNWPVFDALYPCGERLYGQVGTQIWRYNDESYGWVEIPACTTDANPVYFANYTSLCKLDNGSAYILNIWNDLWDPIPEAQGQMTTSILGAGTRLYATKISLEGADAKVGATQSLAFFYLDSSSNSWVQLSTAEMSDWSYAANDTTVFALSPDGTSICVYQLDNLNTEWTDLPGAKDQPIFQSIVATSNGLYGIQKDVPTLFLYQPFTPNWVPISSGDSTYAFNMAGYELYKLNTANQMASRYVGGVDPWAPVSDGIEKIWAGNGQLYMRDSAQKFSSFPGDDSTVSKRGQDSSDDEYNWYFVVSTQDRNFSLFDFHGEIHFATGSFAIKPAPGQKSSISPKAYENVVLKFGSLTNSLARTSHSSSLISIWVEPTFFSGSWMVYDITVFIPDGNCAYSINVYNELPRVGTTFFASPITTPAFDGFEYKLMLNAKKFDEASGEDPTVQDFWDDLMTATGNSGASIVTNSKVRSVTFFDTPKNGLKELDYVLRVRSETKRGQTVWAITLKCRSSNWYRTICTKLPVDSVFKGSVKFEGDVTPSDTKFSQSWTCSSKGTQKVFSSARDAINGLLTLDAFPSEIQNILSSLSDLVPVSGLEGIEETVFETDPIQYGSGSDAVNIAYSLTFWSYNGKLEVPEVSFRVESQPSGYSSRKNEVLLSKITRALGSNWASTNSITKTQWVYNYKAIQKSHDEL